MSILKTYTKYQINNKRPVPKKSNKFVKFFSYIVLVVGFGLLAWSFYPILSFEVYSRFFLEQDVKTPVPDDMLAGSGNIMSTLGISTIKSNNLRDYVKAAAWFPSKPNIQNNLNISSYTISIPKLGILQADVLVGGEDLSQSLVHYYPTSLPGEYGNVVIFGHSSLPQLFNVENYMTIFTHLDSLGENDKIFIYVNGLKYVYEYYSREIVNPTEISVLDQQHEASYLTLITCVPPGTTDKRLVVKAKLNELP